MNNVLLKHTNNDLSNLVSNIFKCNATVYVNPPFEINNKYDEQTRELSINENKHQQYSVIIRNTTSELCDKVPQIKQLCEQILQLQKQANTMSATQDIVIDNMINGFKNPMNSITTMIEMFNATELTKKQAGYLEIMHKGELRLLELINNTIDFAKLVSGKVKFSSVVFNITKLLEDAIHPFKHQITEKNLQVKYIIDTSIPDNFIGDKTRITYLLQILITNAVKFTDKGSIIIDIKGVSTNSMIYQLVITVTDTGIGITDEQCDLMFKLFEQPHNLCNTNKNVGSGLGLNIAMLIAKHYDGGITVNSVLGNGSEFTTTLHVKYVKSEFNDVDCDVLIGKEIMIFDTDLNRKLQIANLVLEFHMKPIMCSCIDEVLIILSINDNISIIIMDVGKLTETAVLTEANTINDLSKKITLIALGNINDPNMLFSYKWSVFNNDFTAATIDDDDSDNTDDNTDNDSYDSDDDIDVIPTNVRRITSPTFIDRIIYSKRDVSGLKRSTSMHSIKDLLQFSKSALQEMLVRSVKGKEKKVSMCVISQQKLDSMRVLIADINEVDTLIEMLNNIGISNIDTTSDGLECLRLLTTNTYDMLFLEVSLLKLDGCGMLKLYNKSNTNEKRPVIICISANSSPEDINNYMVVYKMDLMLPKPMEFMQLNELINMVGEES
jgi:signal transduction histidine kinase/CheY-like chemotaxis protein